MDVNSNRLFFIDAMRAWAILMMLQGHFIDGLLDTLFRDPNNLFYITWRYFRGITAPVFFTVSGFIFTYLLIKAKEKGWKNPRVKKGIRRGLQLLLIGYLLRLNLFGLLIGEIYESFYLVDVLHCIGLSLIAIIAIYLISSNRNKYLFPSILLLSTLGLFLFEPYYKQWSFSFLPNAIANYFTKSNGSVFTIIPWLGYTTLGGFVSILFTKFKDLKHFYPAAITTALGTGLLLIFTSSDGFVFLFEQTGIKLFKLIELNNYLFIRLGDVLLVFAVFMIFRSLMMNKTILKIGANTLSIYVIHFIILYGSFTGLGLYRFFHHQLSPIAVIIGAIAFIFVCTYLSLLYAKQELAIKNQLSIAYASIKQEAILLQKSVMPKSRFYLLKIRLRLLRLIRFVKN
ncbi:acyltransferase family protein [uncultured Croceitalea sp.]|uniref:acyltransferase family protein n=1 Tax=uncultured Croceitalea sp. TaxID=1798908 RepID=UPI0033063B28